MLDESGKKKRAISIPITLWKSYRKNKKGVLFWDTVYNATLTTKH